MSSCILHLDGDDFFASVARLKEPALRNRPLIIGNLLSRGATVAVSREIRDCGIHPGTGINRASQLCPEAALVQIDWALMQKVSKVFVSLVSRYSPCVETAGLDSLFIDYTGCERLFGSADSFAVRLQNEIRKTMGFTVSAGLAADKTVSVVACRAAKLARLEKVKEDFEASFLSSCPISWLPAMTPATCSFFSYLGIHTIGELARIPCETLEHLLGVSGRVLSLQAGGQEHSRVRPCSTEKDIFAKTEFPADLLSTDLIVSRLAPLSSDLCQQLRSRHILARQILTCVTYSDQRISKLQKALEAPSNRDHEVLKTVRESFLKLYTRRVRIRTLSIHARMTRGMIAELPIGAAEIRNRWNKVLLSVDKAKQKFSPETIQLGAALLPFTGRESPKRTETRCIYRTGQGWNSRKSWQQPEVELL